MGLFALGSMTLLLAIVVCVDFGHELADVVSCAHTRERGCSVCHARAVDVLIMNYEFRGALNSRLQCAYVEAGGIRTEKMAHLWATISKRIRTNPQNGWHMTRDASALTCSHDNMTLGEVVYEAHDDDNDDDTIQHVCGSYRKASVCMTEQCTFSVCAANHYYL